MSINFNNNYNCNNHHNNCNHHNNNNSLRFVINNFHYFEANKDL
ncbi:MAG: hypothetical protein ACRC0R_01080 [Cetobacterium sp.]